MGSSGTGRRAGVESDYEERLAARRAALGGLERTHARLSALRIALALPALGLLVLQGVAAAPWLGVLAALFLAAAIRHAQVLNARDRALSAVAFYERGLTRVRHQWMGHGDPGDRFRQPHHLYADDLDLFGRGSLFELVATMRTRAGQEVLAAWLLAPAAPEDAAARQAAIRELMPQGDLREAMAVAGDQVGARVDAAALRAWALAPRHLPGSWLRPIIAALPTAIVSAIAWPGPAPAGLVESLLILQVAVGLSLRPRVKRVIDVVDSPSRDLDLLAELSALVERDHFESPRLTELRQALASTPQASREIARLAQLVALLNSRKNVLFAPISGLLMWATHLAFAIERWRARAGTGVPQWLAAIGEFEALSALAGFAHEHPDFVFAEVHAGPARLTATALAHPLLGDDAVANDLSLGAASPDLLVVSGSNMSGKSTFLRAIGLNLVLAQTGAPVRAASFVMAAVAIGASIRVVDSLQDGRSRFYAEIVRLKQIVEAADARRGALIFLFDEILSGTNSHDRREGAARLVAGFLAKGAIGLVTTHDLTLGEIADALAPRAANVHFSDEFKDGVLHFDYRLRPGTVRTSNALALMRSIGLDV